MTSGNLQHELGRCQFLQNEVILKDNQNPIFGASFFMKGAFLRVKKVKVSLQAFRRKKGFRIDSSSAGVNLVGALRFSWF